MCEKLAQATNGFNRPWTAEFIKISSMSLERSSLIHDWPKQFKLQGKKTRKTSEWMTS